MPNLLLCIATSSRKPEGGQAMSVARVTEIIASSKKGFDHAIEKGIHRASKTLRNVQGAWVKQMKIICEDGEIKAYRVDLKVTFVLENDDAHKDEGEEDEQEDEEEDKEEDDKPE
jgi:dodecin